LKGSFHPSEGVGVGSGSAGVGDGVSEEVIEGVGVISRVVEGVHVGVVVGVGETSCSVS
jgi:hypothetical protein